MDNSSRLSTMFLELLDRLYSSGSCEHGQKSWFMDKALPTILSSFDIVCVSVSVHLISSTACWYTWWLWLAGMEKVLESIKGSNPWKSILIFIYTKVFIFYPPILLEWVEGVWVPPSFPQVSLPLINYIYIVFRTHLTTWIRLSDLFGCKCIISMQNNGHGSIHYVLVVFVDL